MQLQDENNYAELLYQLNRLSVADSLQHLSFLYANKIVFSTSFSFEDQAITHIIASNKIPISIFTLDTGRLFAETYAVWSATLAKYPISIKAYYPNETELQNFVVSNGPNAFYQSIDHRKQCCAIRKVQPLQKALKGNAVWVTGLRAEHSSNREALPILEWDEANQLYKYHPLLHWSTEEVKTFITQRNVPYNPLHDKGFVSIGCAPCTRAIKEGEDFRAGRWWWEDANKKECGLHTH
jgi:phosphoadenosine phosphosulfate reductase